MWPMVFIPESLEELDHVIVSLYVIMIARLDLLEVEEKMLYYRLDGTIELSISTTVLSV